jgi:hypothetical protein
MPRKHPLHLSADTRKMLEMLAAGWLLKYEPEPGGWYGVSLIHPQGYTSKAPRYADAGEMIRQKLIEPAEGDYRYRISDLGRAALSPAGAAGEEN